MFGTFGRVWLGKTGSGGGLGPPPLVFGPELIINGDGGSAANWDAQLGGTATAVGGRLRVTTDGSSPFANAQQLQFGVLDIGASYNMRGTMYAGTAGAGVAAIWIAMDAADTKHHLDADGADVDFLFVADSANITVNLLPRNSLGNSGTAGQYAEFDNISLRKVL